MTDSKEQAYARLQNQLAERAIVLPDHRKQTATAGTAIVTVPAADEASRMVLIDLDALGLDETWAFCQLTDTEDGRTGLLFHPDDGEFRDCPHCLEDPDGAISLPAGYGQDQDDG